MSSKKPVASSAGPVLLKNGANEVDLLGDRTAAQAFVAWRGNYNAHGFSTVAFYILAQSDLGDTAAVWQAVPFFGGPNDGDTGREVFTTSEGADCTLKDLRVITKQGSPATVIVARRVLGESFAAAEAVRFEYYELARNTDGGFGWPPFYFQFSKSVSASKKFCDVNEAFAKELGLSATGLGHAEGGR